MTRVVSTGTKIEQVAGLLGKQDLTPWEAGFVESMVGASTRAKAAGQPPRLSEKQLDILDRIWHKHFA
jgi:hypothetical protein